MELKQIQQFIGDVYKGVERRTSRVCSARTNVGEEPQSSYVECQLDVGRDRVVLFFRPVGGSDRHTLVVRSSNTQHKSFRETKGGGFLLERVIVHIRESVDIETAMRREEERKRQLIQSAENTIEHWKRKDRIPEGVALSVSEECIGKINIQARDLPEDVVLKILGIIELATAVPKGSERDLWRHLQEKDEE